MRQLSMENSQAMKLKELKIVNSERLRIKQNDKECEVHIHTFPQKKHSFRAYSVLPHTCKSQPLQKKLPDSNIYLTFVVK